MTFVASWRLLFRKGQSKPTSLDANEGFCPLNSGKAVTGSAVGHFAGALLPRMGVSLPRS
jgi:uncharacterized protein (DUF952 family)